MHSVISEEDYLAHYGILRRSGRYPWGSGGNAEQNHRSFLGMVDDLRAKGLSESAIAKGFDISTTQLRALKSVARNEVRAANIAMAQRLRDKGWSHKAIAERMGLAGESSVRALLAPGAADKANEIANLSDMLRDQVAQKTYLDVGVGTERYVGVARTQLDTAISVLTNEGYELINVQEDQLGTGNKTTYKILAPPDTQYKDVVTNKEKIRNLAFNELEDGTYKGVEPPLSFDSKRLDVVYGEDGGGNADGVIYVRPGVEDVTLGGAQYAQVRILVDGTHYIKGMAVYKDDLPDGIDLQFNTPKSKSEGKLGVLKAVKEDSEDPFGAVTKQIPDKNGKPISVMNVVNEEGDWSSWSKSLASQMLSKQKPILAKEQLEKTLAQKQKDLDEILELTNPAVKRKLLEAYADSVDSSSVHLKAAAMPRQQTQVILPINSLKDTEIYAPQFKNGERVALIRYPHGGTFEIPELTVNNNNVEGKSIITSKARDAVGINSRVAERLSGADFDGDTVLVIPNNSGKIKSTPALEGLKNFDPKTAYPKYEGMPKMTPKMKQSEMGKVSNLITDMTIKGANTSEIARAVRHSMVVIDAEKKELNYKQSYIDNGIAQLKAKYQDGSNKGASTLISRTTSEERVPKRKQNYRIDPDTGEKIYNYTGEGYIQKRTNKKTGVVTEKFVPRTTKSTKGAEAKDAHTLSSGTTIEKIYADHSNALKSLANKARKTLVNTESIPYSPSAKKVYSKEVSTLNAALNVALKNAPKERQAQLIANAQVRQKRASNPDMGSDEIKKISAKALNDARQRVGAGKTLVKISPVEWEAIQAGAISNSKLTKILNNADLDEVKKLATPRKPTVMTSAKQQRAKQLLASGRTPSEVAEILGVAVTTMQSSLDAG